MQNAFLFLFGSEFEKFKFTVRSIYLFVIAFFHQPKVSGIMKVSA